MGKVKATTIIDVIPLEDNVMWLYSRDMTPEAISQELDIGENQVRKIIMTEDKWKD